MDELVPRKTIFGNTFNRLKLISGSTFRTFISSDSLAFSVLIGAGLRRKYFEKNVDLSPVYSVRSQARFDVSTFMLKMQKKNGHNVS